MHLAYLDDSGTGNKKTKFQVMTAVIVEGWEFPSLEVAMGAAIEHLVPKEKFDSFEEFHAFELFGGYGPFEGVAYEKRMEVVGGLLDMVTEHHVPIVYGAVDMLRLAQKPYASADPLDICFRICTNGLDFWAGTHLKFPARTDVDVQPASPQVVLIVDDFQKETKERIRKSFRSLRTKVKPPDYTPNLYHLHDSLYFGNSKDSIGIQLADICGYIIRKQLEEEKSVQGFYDTIKPHIAYREIEPIEEAVPLSQGAGE